MPGRFLVGSRVYVHRGFANCLSPPCPTPRRALFTANLMTSAADGRGKTPLIAIPLDTVLIHSRLRDYTSLAAFFLAHAGP